MNMNEYYKLSTTVLNRIKDTSPGDIVDGYKQIEIRVGFKDDKPVTSLIWKSWKLQICSFEAKPTTEVMPLSIFVDDQIYMHPNGQDLIVRTHTDDKTQNWDQLRRAYVYEVIDAFLSGDWTPPWKCGFCRDRVKGLVKPQW
jgi:hypothetical protein